MLEVLSFTNNLLGYGLTSFNKDSSANFSGEKSTIKISKVSILRVYVKKLSHGSYNFRQTHFKYFSRIFKDKLQFSRTKIYLINRHSLTPLDHPIGVNSSWSHLRFLLLRPSLITLFYSTFHCIASEVQKKHLKYRNRNRNKILLMHKNVFTLPVSFTGSYTEDEPNFLSKII